jgi:hypothetical protein
MVQVLPVPSLPARHVFVCVNALDPLAPMLVKVTGFDPVAVFFTVTVAVAVVSMTISLKVTLEGVMLSVGAEVAAAGITISQAAISATMQPQILKDRCTVRSAGRNLWTMERELMTVSTTAI